MKKLMILVSAIMMVATANAKRVETSSFNEVRVDVPARVRIVVGDTYCVNITAANKYIEDAVRAKVKDGILTLNVRDLEQLGDSTNSLRITIVTPVAPKFMAGRMMETRVITDAMDDSERDVAVK